MKPAEALIHYDIEGAVKSIAPFGLGHINETFRVELIDSVLLLQRINTSIFKDLDAFETNLSVIINASNELFPFHYQTKEGDYHLSQQGEVWRLQEFVAHSIAPSLIKSPEMAFQLGYGFGRFTQEMAQIAPSSVKEAIPNFHSLPPRIKRFQDVVEQNPQKRNQNCKGLIERTLEYVWIQKHFEKLIENGLPKRVCHNDAKSTNILLDKEGGQFLKIIDLDTVGPGYTMFDFGDMIRSIAIQAYEGDRNFMSYDLQIDLIEANRKGYLSTCGDLLSTEEIDSLYFGSLYMTYFTGIRMLTDYLEGDVYYKIDQSDDNYIRARNQFYVLDLLNDHFDLF